MKIRFFNLVDKENDAILDSEQMEELFKLFKNNDVFNIDSDLTKNATSFKVSELSNNDYKLLFLYKNRKLKNTAFQSIEYDNKEIDNVSLKEFTLFVLNKSACCAVLEYNTAPKFPSNMKALLNKNLDKPNYAISSVLNPDYLTQSEMVFVEKLIFSSCKGKTGADTSHLINKVSDATKIDDGFIKQADLSIVLEENVPFKEVSDMFKKGLGYKRATIKGTDKDGEVLFDTISTAITRYINIDLNEEIDKRKLQTIFDELVQSFSHL